MIFIKSAVEAKNKHLDEVLKSPELINDIIEKNLGKDWKIENKSRIWEPGGGSTLFLCEKCDKKYFVKVKHKDIGVESQLEGQKIINTSSLQNEVNMNKKINSNYVTEIIFFDQIDEYEVLAQEYVEYSLLDVLAETNVSIIMNVWNQIEYAIRNLYERGIVHCDLHENNIRCKRDYSIVLIDLEECRELEQNCSFEESLDVCGKYKDIVLGENPLAQTQNFKNNINCLNRLKELFDMYLIEKLPRLIKECNYDSTNGICTALDHGKSDLIYQSLDTKYIKVNGQRPIHDVRLGLLKKAFKFCIGENIVDYVDIGSNNGNFCRFMNSVVSKESKIYGLEGFHKFNELARVLSFLEEQKNAVYKDFVCGEDDISTIDIRPNSFMSMCSVYHHILNKDEFLYQIKESNISYIFIEMAIQNECYGGRTWEEEIDRIVQILDFKEKIVLTMSKDYRRPIILLSKNEIDENRLMNIKNECEIYSGTF